MVSDCPKTSRIKDSRYSCSTSVSQLSVYSLAWYGFVLNRLEKVGTKPHHVEVHDSKSFEGPFQPYSTPLGPYRIQPAKDSTTFSTVD